MKKRTTNNLKWTADLLKLQEYKDPETDRPVKDYQFVRKLRYNNIGALIVILKITKKIIEYKSANVFITLNESM